MSKFTAIAKSKFTKVGFAAVALCAAGVAAQAGTSGTEFQASYDLIVGWINGYLGKAIALSFFLIGIFQGVARQNIMAAGMAIAAAFAIVVVPTILDGVLTSTVSAETVQVVSSN